MKRIAIPIIAFALLIILIFIFFKDLGLFFNSKLDSSRSNKRDSDII